MIDWVTAILPCDHDPSKLISGMVMSFDAKGESEWVVNKKLTVEGSHSTKIQIKSHTDSQIWISGNPAKFLQGHNIFGTDDLSYLMGRFFDALLTHDELGLTPTDVQYESIQAGSYSLKRVDINQSWLLRNRDDVLSWIRSAGACARLKHRGAGQYSGDTLYFAKHSRRWSVKCYSKGSEINAKGHQLPKDLQVPELIEWADRALRLELVLRSMQLKDMMLDIGSNWCSDTAKVLLCSLVLDNLELSDNMTIKCDILDTLPVRLRLVYQSWLSGEDLRKIMSKTAFYRWRKQLLEYGIDIAILNQDNRSNVVPLIRYLEAEPAQIPDWAYEKRLVA